MKPLLIITGPTASGKTHLAAGISERIGGEIISADSRQVYRGMNIGTGKDLNEYTIDGRQIPYHLIDIRNAGEQYNVNEFQKDFAEAYFAINTRNNIPVVCGGTGFYIYSILKGHAYASIPTNDALRKVLDSYTLEQLQYRFLHLNTPYSDLADTSTRKRLIRAVEISEYLIQNPGPGKELFARKVNYECIIYGLNPDVNLRRNRISTRLKYRLANGLVEEVQGLLRSGLTGEQLIYYGLEYKYVTMYLLGELNYEDMSQRLETEIHRFAKRQMTFFRKMEREGFNIHWIDQALTLEQQIDIIKEGYQSMKVSDSSHGEFKD